MKKFTKSDKKMVGILLPPELYNYFSLVCLAEGRSKTKVGEGIVENFYRVNSKKQPSSLLINKIKNRIVLEWQCRKHSTKFEDFKKEVKISLQAEGLKTDQIQQILDFEK